MTTVLGVALLDVDGIRYARPPVGTGRTCRAFERVPYVAAGLTNDPGTWDRAPVPLGLLLRTADLPDELLATLAGAGGESGVVHLRHNPWIGEDLWRVLYDKTEGIGRQVLVSNRVLSDAQVHHVVHVERETSPWVLPELAPHCSDTDLEELLRRPLSWGTRKAVEGVRSARASGRNQRVRDIDGRGRVELHDDPYPEGLRMLGDVSEWRLTTPGNADVSELAIGVAVGSYLLAQLGRDAVPAWEVLGRILEITDLTAAPDDRGRGGATPTWGGVTTAAAAIVCPRPPVPTP